MSTLLQPTVLIINASLAGEAGNTAVLLRRAKTVLCQNAIVTTATLSASFGYLEVRPQIAVAQAILIGTGTHWDSWSHLLQKFLEDATQDEATDMWLGKPAGVVVTMHSVGGKGVVSRLQGILNTLGCSLPPLSGMVYSLVNQVALSAGGEGTEDVWSPEDVEVICHNLLAALSPQPRYRSWPVDRSHYACRWIREAE